VELAQTRIAALGAAAGAATAGVAAPPRAETQTAAAPLPGGRPELLPRAGDTWRYRMRDQFRIGDLFVTAKVDQVTPDGVAETWTTTSDAKVRTTLVPLGPG